VGPRVTIEKFSSDFISYLAAADLSISMAGYNTCMNILASRVRALVWPFPQNHEQTMRAGRLAAIGALEVFDRRDLSSQQLERKINRCLSRRLTVSLNVNIEGAANTVRWLER
jgi:predicted glycosyltransferase